MRYTVQPATAERFDDIATVLAARNPDTAACWCLTYRLPPRQNRQLSARERPRLVETLSTRAIPPGVLAYDGEEVVGWCGVAPRTQLHAFTHGTRFPQLDDLPVWSVWCFRVRAGRRRQGVAQALLEGAVEHARAHGAPAVEGYPVDNQGRKLDTTMAYVGTRAMFERAGFRWAAATGAVSNGIPRVLMRRELR